MNIIVYSAIFGGYDHIRPPQNRNDQARYVLFTDKQVHTPAWESIVVEPQYTRRKQARYFKLLAHQHFPKADVTVWVDGWLQLIVDPFSLLDYLGDNDIAMEKHLERGCLYEEAMEVIRVKKVLKPEYAREQVARYGKQGFPAKWGLSATYLVVRRNTPAIAEMEKLWWHELDNHTLRDQLSLMYCLWKTGLGWSRIPHGQGSIYKSYPHAAKSY